MRYTLQGYSTNMAGYEGKKSAIQQRLRRVEGQVRGVQRMVDDDAYCIDVLTQISAATKALQAVALELLDEHLAHCVADALAQGGDAAQDKVAEASAAIARLVRS
jgi:CsoR family transcriptional regulator, copper-sensing transcriptional repressor